MKTKNIFKTLVAAMLMPAMLLTTACSSEDDFAGNENTENAAKKGYTLPVTVNVTRQGDEAATRAAFNSETKKLEFSTGDKLFVSGSQATAGSFAGTLDYVSDGTFSGTITTENEYSGTIDDLFASAYAYLLPNGYGSYGYLSIDEGNGYDADINDDGSKAFALTKAAAVEQLSKEWAYGYSSGFALEPNNAILNFTISGLAASTEVAVVFSIYDYGEFYGAITGNVTTDASGTATFAIGVEGGMDLNDCPLTVGGNAITLVSSSKQVESGKIYNIIRSVAPAGTDLSKLTADYTAQNGETLTGTLGGNYKISIADGATVTLDGVTINGTNNDNYSWAGLTLEGDATIILADGSTNTVKGFYEDYPGIHVLEGKTLTISGDGSLNASSNGSGAGIGGGWNKACGNISITGGIIVATGSAQAAGIGGGYYSACGNISITGGTITATGGSKAAGIGGGEDGSCGNITITDGVTSVTATKGIGETNSIGAGANGSCGTVTITAASGKVVQN